MKIVLINPPSYCVEDDRVEQSLGLAYIASTLLENKYDVKIVELTGNKNRKIEEIITEIPIADIYGITCYSTNYKSVQKIVDHIKKENPSAYICLGGPHPTAIPDETINDLDVDSVVIGEGETAFLHIVNNFKEGKRFKGIIEFPVIEELDKIPFPNRMLVNQNTFTRTFHGKKVISLISSRGCKYKCLHCNSVVMGGASKKVRYRSSQNIINEIKLLKKNGYDSFRFNDDNFGDNPNLHELLKMIKKEKIRYRIFSRIEHLTDDNIKHLSESGCDLISIGLESLNENNLKFLGKKSQLSHLDNLRKARQYNISTRVSFMVGLPYDTDESITEDFQKSSQLEFDEYAIYPLIPYPGTQIYRFPERYNYEILNPDFTEYVQMGINKKTVFALKHTDPNVGFVFYPEDVKRWYDMAENILSKTKLHMSKSQIAK